MSDISNISVRLVSSAAEFMALEPQWNALTASNPRFSVFSRHEWFDAAWRWRHRTAQLNLLCGYAGQRLVAVLPLVLQEIRTRGCRLRELTFLTVPDTQSGDVIVAEADIASASTAFASELTKSRNEWDVIRLKYLGSGSIAASTLREALEARKFTTRLSTTPGNPFIALDTNWAEYYATRSRRLKKANNLAANRLQKSGEVRIEWLAPEAGTGASLESFLERAIAISASSWKTRTGNTLDNPGPQSFIRRLTEVAYRRGWLSIWILSVNGRPLAMEYQLIADGNVYALRSDFVAECEEISPGTHLNRCLLEQLFGLGLRRYYMGPGNNAYKHRWTEHVEPIQELTVYGRSLAGQCLAVWETALKPVAIRLRNRLRRTGNEKSEGD